MLGIANFGLDLLHAFEHAGLFVEVDGVDDRFFLDDFAGLADVDCGLEFVPGEHVDLDS